MSSVHFHCTLKNKREVPQKSCSFSACINDNTAWTQHRTGVRVFQVFISATGACESSVVITFVGLRLKNILAAASFKRHTEAAYISTYINSLPLSCLAVDMPQIWHCTFCSPYTCLANRGKVVAPPPPTYFIYLFISHTLRAYTPVQQFGCSLC